MKMKRYRRSSDKIVIQNKLFEIMRKEESMKIYTE